MRIFRNVFIRLEDWTVIPEGMLLMTNDGDFANAMTHPSMHIPKTYRVTVRPSITEDQITEMTVGMMIDGKKTAPRK